MEPPFCISADPFGYPLFFTSASTPFGAGNSTGYKYGCCITPAKMVFGHWQISMLSTITEIPDWGTIASFAAF